MDIKLKGRMGVTNVASRFSVSHPTTYLFDDRFYLIKPIYTYLGTHLMIVQSFFFLSFFLFFFLCYADGAFEADWLFWVAA